MSDWISVDEDVPEDGSLVCVLVGTGNGPYQKGVYLWRNPAGPIRDFFTPPYTKLGIVKWMRIPDEIWLQDEKGGK